MMKKYCILLIINVLCMSQSLQGQYLLLSGGGAEDFGSWSDTPYRQAVDYAPNKRVAIIGTESSSTWLADYFLNLGAFQVKDFVVPNRMTALEGKLYDSLRTYDLIFLRGGDQALYWEYFHETSVSQAIKHNFNDQKVIGGTSAGMAILSEIFFSAQYGTVYSDEMLANPFNSYCTLDTGFLPLFENAIFDTHFAERGRLPRLVGFLANQKLAHGRTPIGIGVDDKTAFFYNCLAQTGTCYGSGAVSIVFYNDSTEVHTSESGQLVLENLSYIQLVDEISYEFEAQNAFPYLTRIDATQPSFPYEGQVFVGGSDILNRNSSIYLDFAYIVTDTICIIA